MAKEPVEVPPWFFTVLERERELPGLMAVVVVDSAVMMRSGFGTVTWVDEQRALLFSMDSVMALPLSALVQT